MKKIVVILAVLVAGILIGAWGMGLLHGNRPSVKKDGQQAERKVLFYRNSMDPSITSDKPAKDSMGMDYIAVYADEAPADASLPGFTVSPEKIQRIGVKSQPVQRRLISRAVRAVGRVDYDETRLATVNAKISGWVEKLIVDKTGEWIRKGEPLLMIYSPDLVSTQQEYLLALDAKARGVRGADDLVRSAEQRLRYWDIPEHEIQTIAESKAPSKTLTLAAPVSGVVIEKMVVEGTAISPGATLYKLADLSTVWVTTDIYEYELRDLKVGQGAKITLTTYPGRTFQGRVGYIYPYLEAETRTARVRIELKNPDGTFKPQMYANVEIDTGKPIRALAVPESAVIDTGVRQVVLLDHEGGRFEAREVQGGERSGGWIEIRSGLNEGDRVVTSANFLLDSESNLRAALSALGRGKTPTPAAGEAGGAHAH